MASTCWRWRITPARRPSGAWDGLSSVELPARAGGAHQRAEDEPRAGDGVTERERESWVRASRLEVHFSRESARGSTGRAGAGVGAGDPESEPQPGAWGPAPELEPELEPEPEPERQQPGVGARSRNRPFGAQRWTACRTCGSWRRSARPGTRTPRRSAWCARSRSPVAPRSAPAPLPPRAPPLHP